MRGWSKLKFFFFQILVVQVQAPSCVNPPRTLFNILTAFICRMLFKDDIVYEDLVLIVAPVARSVAGDDRVWKYTKGLAGRMRHKPQDEGSNEFYQ